MSSFLNILTFGDAECPVCKRQFEKHHPNHNYCSRRCRRKPERIRAQARETLFLAGNLPVKSTGSTANFHSHPTIEILEAMEVALINGEVKEQQVFVEVPAWKPNQPELIAWEFIKGKWFMYLKEELLDSVADLPPEEKPVITMIDGNTYRK